MAFSLTVPALDDTLDEDNETVILTLSNPVNALLIAPSQHVITIVDNDDPPTVSFSQADSAYEEGTGAVTVQVVLSAASAKTIQISFTRTGNAIPGTDFTLTTASPLTFAPGETSKTIDLNIPDDDRYTGLRLVVFTLSTPVNVTVGAIPVHTLTIIENEICPTVSSLNFNSDQITTIVSLPTSATAVTLRDLTVVMDGGNQRLNGVYLGTGGTSQIFTGSLSGTVTIFETGSPTWTGGVRTLNGGEGKTLLLDFLNDIASNKRDRYSITVYWSNGCSATVTP
jgi:hypothetical protein